MADPEKKTKEQVMQEIEDIYRNEPYISENIMNKICRLSIDNGISAEETSKLLCGIELPSGDNLNDRLEEAGSNVRFKGSSSSQKKEKSAFRKQALDSFVRVYYERENNIQGPLLEAEKRGIITPEERKELGSGRDPQQFFFLIGSDSKTVERNMETIKILAGKNLDKNDPNFEKEKQKGIAKLYEKRVEELSEGFDPSTVLGMSDKELIGSWKKIENRLFAISIIEGVRTHAIMAGNPFVKPETDEKRVKLQLDSLNAFYYARNRVAMLTSPYYAKYNMEPLYGLNGADADSFYIDGDPILKRFALEASGTGSGFNMMCGDFIAKDQGVLAFEKLKYFDKEGKPVADIDINGVINKDGVVFASLPDDGGSLKAYTVDPKTRKFLVADAAKYENEMNSIRAKLPVKEQPVDTHPNRTNFFNRSEQLGTNLSKMIKEDVNHELADSIVNEYCRKEPHWNKDIFYDEFNVPYSRQLSQAEIADRNITAEIGIRNMIQSETDYHEAMNFDKSGYKLIPGFNIRFFDSFMCSYNPADKAKNEELYKLFDVNNKEPGVDVKRAEALKARFEHLLSMEKMLDKPYTDRELAENWPKFNELFHAAGMEYESSMRAIANNKIGISNDLKERMDKFHKKVDAFDNFYHNQLDYICTEYYKFGGEKQLHDSFGKYKFNGNHSLEKSGNLAFQAEENRNIAFGSMMLDGAESPEKEIAYIVDDHHNRIEKDEHAVGELLRSGKEVTVIYKNNEEPQIYSSKKSDLFPPKFDNPPVTREKKLDIVATKLTFEKVDALDKSKDNIDLQILDANLLANKMNLADKINDKKNPNYGDDVKLAAAELLARTTIKTMIDTQHPDDKTIHSMNSAENIKSLANNLLGSGVVDKVVENISKDALDVLNMSDDDFIKEMKTATELVKQQKTLEAKGPEKSAEKEKIQVAG